MYVQAFGEHYDSGLYTEKYHQLGHILKDNEDLEGNLFWTAAHSSGAFQGTNEVGL